MLTCSSLSPDATHGFAGGLGAIAGRVSEDERIAWASAVPVMTRTDGAYVSTFRIGATVLSHLEAKPVSTRLGTAMPGKNFQPFQSMTNIPSHHPVREVIIKGSIDRAVDLQTALMRVMKRLRCLTTTHSHLIPLQALQGSLEDTCSKAPTLPSGKQEHLDRFWPTRISAGFSLLGSYQSRRQCQRAATLVFRLQSF